MSADRRNARVAPTLAQPSSRSGGKESPQSTLTFADVPGHGRFFLTEAAAEMIGVFGGSLHCYLGDGGCRKQGLYFSLTLPRKFLRCEVQTAPGEHGDQGAPGVPGAGLEITVSHELAPRLDGALLDFGLYNKMQRFVWASLPAVKGP